ncbi:MAG: CDP-glycerol glycerophosphotransferase family protein [Cyanobacteriota bacterium]|nr:CDP-glycerol glycerophosphotransferase family protein [Cyanobacteriota bacterium]
MPKLRPWEYLFSLTNSGTDKLIMFLGIPIRIDRSGYYRKFCAQLPIDENKIVVDNFNGGSYGCNPKYVVEELLKRNKNYDIVWLVKSVKNAQELNVFPPQVRLVGYGTKQGLKELASAKLWIDNQRKNYFIKKGLRKKEGQYFIQTWHGSLGIKRLDADVDAFTNEFKQEWVERAKFDSSMWDYLLTNSEFENKIFRHALWFNNEIKQFGHPRNDIFFKDTKAVTDKVKKYYDIDEDKKILLYVPSFRDDNDIECYKLDYDRILKTLEDKIGGKWVCITRLHPRAKKFDSDIIPENNPHIIDGTFYPDIQELLAAANCAITDYSSCIFDFMLSYKPGFIFATDIEKFNTDRGFYYPLEDTPFPIASDNDTLIKNIENFDIDKYKKETAEFIKNKGCIEDGHAAQRTADLVEEIMQKYTKALGH